MTAPARDAATAQFEQLRSRLNGLAYRMLGSAADAADIVQEAHLRFHATDPATVRDIDSYLLTIVTRLCLDELKSARLRRERYVGAWLPEPIATTDELSSPDAVVGLRESVSIAFLVVLDRLDPVERAVLLLHDVFDIPHAQMATMLARSEAGCRQLLKRAREHVAKHARPRRAIPRDEQVRLARRFVAALDRGDVGELATMLVADAVAYADGGGKVAAALRPILGADRVARYALALCDKGTTRIELRELNGEPGVVTWSARRLCSVIVLSLDDNRVAELYVQRNPDKLLALASAPA